MPFSDDLAHLLLGQPDLAEQLMRSLALKGALPSYCGAEFEPSITVEDFTRPEFLFMRRMVRISQGRRLPAVAAQFSQAILYPQSGAPRTLCVCESVVIGNPNATAINIGVQVGSPNIAVTKAVGVGSYPHDERAWSFNAAYVPSFALVNATNVASLIDTAALPFNLPGNTSLVIPMSAVLTAKDITSTPSNLGVMLACSAVNTAIDIGFTWRERTILGSES